MDNYIDSVLYFSYPYYHLSKIFDILMKGVMLMKKVSDIFDGIVENIIFACTAGFVFISFIQVIFRYVFNNSLSWSEELCRYLFVITVFFGSAVGLLHRKHVSVDVIEKIIPVKFRHYFIFMLDIFVTVFAAFLGYVGLQMATKSMTQPSPAMQVPLGYIYLAIPLGCAVMCINTLRRAIIDFKSAKQQQLESTGGDLKC